MEQEACGWKEKLSQVKPIFGFTDDEALMIDFDNVTFKTAKYWAFRTMRFQNLEGFIILKSSERCYHVVFNRSVDWSENVSIMAWIALLSNNKGLQKYHLLQCIKQSSTLRISDKNEKPSPRIVYRYGKQDDQIQSFLEYRKLIKRIIKKKEKPKHWKHK